MGKVDRGWVEEGRGRVGSRVPCTRLTEVGRGWAVGGIRGQASISWQKSQRVTDIYTGTLN